MKVVRFDMGTKYIGRTGAPDIIGKTNGRFVLHADFEAITADLLRQIATLEASTVNQTLTIAELTAEKQGLEHIVSGQADEIAALRADADRYRRLRAIACDDDLEALENMNALVETFADPRRPTTKEFDVMVDSAVPQGGQL